MKYYPKSNVVFGGVSLSDYNAFAFDCNVFEQPSRNLTTVNVPGRNGAIVFDNGNYSDMSRIYRVQTIGYENAKNLEAAINSVVGYSRLEDEYEDGMFMLARFDKIAQPRFVGQVSAFSIWFTRKPQKFFKSGEASIEFTDRDVTIYNPTLYDALPLIRVYGEGDLTIGDDVISISSNPDYIDIDCDLQDAYNGTINMNASLILSNGRFFRLHSGTNNITLGTGITKIVITPRWWTL